MSALVILKPDAVQRQIYAALISEIVPHYPIVGMQMLTLSAYQCAELYQHHVTKHYWHRIQDHMMSGPSIVLNVVIPHWGTVGELREACLSMRMRYKSNDPNEAANVIHCTELSDDAYREVDIFFPGQYQ